MPLNQNVYVWRTRYGQAQCIRRDNCRVSERAGGRAAARSSTFCLFWGSGSFMRIYTNKLAKLVHENKTKCQINTHKTHIQTTATTNNTLLDQDKNIHGDFKPKVVNYIYFIATQTSNGSLAYPFPNGEGSNWNSKGLFSVLVPCRAKSSWAAQHFL